MPQPPIKNKGVHVWSRYESLLTPRHPVGCRGPPSSRVRICAEKLPGSPLLPSLQVRIYAEKLPGFPPSSRGEFMWRSCLAPPSLQVANLCGEVASFPPSLPVANLCGEVAWLPPSSRVDNNFLITHYY